MITYLIDGNNVIGKDRQLNKIHKNDPTASREGLVFRVDRWAASKKIKVVIFFDGHPKFAINSTSAEIRYSGNKTADELIKSAIDQQRNTLNVFVISSDTEVFNYARVSRCNPVLSEEFCKSLDTTGPRGEEEQTINRLSRSNSEFLDLFLNSGGNKNED